MRFALLSFLLVSRLACLAQVPTGYTKIEDEAIATLHVEGYPDWVEIDGNSVWISNSALNSLQRIDPTTNKIIAEIKVNGPCAAFTTGFGSVWVASCKDKAIQRIREADNRIEAAIPMSLADDEGSIVAGEGAVWVLSDTKGKLSRIDPASNTMVASIAVKPYSFAVMAGYGSVWVTNTGPLNGVEMGSVQRIDPRTNAVIITIPVGKQPRFLAVGEGGVWVFNQGDGSVSRIDPAANKVVATIDCHVPGTGGDIAAGEGYVWVRAKQELLLVIDPASNKVIKNFGPPSGSGAVRAGGGSVWVTAHDVNKIWRLNPRIIKN